MGGGMQASRLPAPTSRQLERSGTTRSVGSMRQCRGRSNWGCPELPPLTWKTCSSSSSSGSMRCQLSLGTETTFSTVPTSAGREG